MYGSWRFNLIFASLGLVIVFLIGLTKNPWTISLLRGVYSFILFFLLAYIIRYIVGSLFIQDTQSTNEENQSSEEQPGSQIDYVTPDGEEDLNEILREQMNQGNKAEHAQASVEPDAKSAQFQPLNPKKLVSTDKMKTEDLTRAVRHLTGE